MDIEALYQKIAQDRCSAEDFEACAAHVGSDKPGVFNALAILFARRFLDGFLSFEEADDAVNLIWHYMLKFSMASKAALVEPCYSIYCAFDAGEYDHKDGRGPVEGHTKPTLLKVLENA